MHAEQDPNRDIEHRRENAAMQRIRALHAKASDDIKSANKWREQADVGDVELAVGVHEHDEIAGGRSEARGERGTVASVDAVVHHPDVFRMSGGKRVSDDGRGIPAAIVDDNDFKLVNVLRQDVERLLHDDADIGFLIVRWQDE
jgi:hypothetical protein